MIAAADLAQRIREDRPADVDIRDFLIGHYPDVRVGTLKQALLILIEMEEQDDAEEIATGVRP